jgi:hypothetical protein
MTPSNPRGLLPALAGAALLAAVVTGGCAAPRVPGGNFQVECNVPEAALLIDDVLVGRCSEWAPPGRAIRPGWHRVEIRHPGYYSHYAEIELREGGGASLRAHLHPLLE